MAEKMQMSVLIFLTIFLVFRTSTANNEYEDEYKEFDTQHEETGNSDEFEFVSVTSDGKVMPFHWNPADRDPENEKPIEIIPKKKVIGGKESNPGAVPYIVNIERMGNILCGGTIYNSRTILTAAHCFHDAHGPIDNWTREKLTYVAGEFKMRAEEGHEQRRKAVSVLSHPKYHHKSSYFDIAIVTVDKPFQYNQYVQPLPVDRPHLVPEKVGTAHVAGWGYTLKRKNNDHLYPKHFPSTLREANVRVFSQDECYGFYGKHKNIKPYVDAGLICAGTENGSTDTCQGDSGGPLACYNPKKGNRRYLCGIVATGIGCGLPGFPGFYTRVAEFHDWVIANAGYADRRTIDDTRDSI